MHTKIRIIDANIRTITVLQIVKYRAKETVIQGLY